MVVTLSIQAALDARPSGEVSDVPAELPALVFTLDAVLAVITLTALVAVALLSVRERIRDFGVLRTIGLTPRQIAASLVSVHAAVAADRCAHLDPVGIGLYFAVYGSPAATARTSSSPRGGGSASSRSRRCS